MNPKLRPEVQFFSMGNAIFHVYDPSTGKHYKMGEQEVGWLKLLDGSRAKDEYRGEIPEEYFDRFFAQATHLGLLNGTATKRPFDVFKMKVGTYNPSRLLDGMADGAVLYRRCLTGTFPILVVLNIALFAMTWSGLRHSLESFHFNAWTIPVYLLAVLFIGLIHEGSHAVVARSHGVNVPAIGLMLLYLHPAFYADVSGINLLKSNRSRISVLLAGIMANNLLVAVALLAYPFVTLGNAAAGAYVAYFALINVLLILMNLIPFIEYDGHYVLLALFDEPNFAANAWRSIRNRGPKKFEYVAYLVLYHILTVAVTFLALMRVRGWVLHLTRAAYVNYVCVALMAISYGALAKRTVMKKA